MKPPIIGLDVSDASVEVVSVRRQRGSFVIDRYGRAAVPPGLIDRGVIRDAEALTKVLASLFDSVFGPRRPRLRAGVAIQETAIFSKVFSFPANFSREVALKALAIEAADVFPILMVDAVSDALIVSRTAESQEVLYAVTDRREATTYARVLGRAGVQPLFFDGEGLALVRALADPSDAEPVLIADIGAKTTLLLLYDQRTLTLSANLPMGGDRLTAALKDQLNITLEQAERVKREAGFDPAVANGRAFLVMQQPMADILEEIKRTADFYEKKTSRRVGKLILAGGTSLTPGIADYASSNLSGMTVELGDPLRHSSKAPAGGGSVSAETLSDAAKFQKTAILYSTAIGLAVRAAGGLTDPGLNFWPDVRAGSGAKFSALIGRLASFAGGVLAVIGRRRRTKIETMRSPSLLPKKRFPVLGLVALGLAVAVFVGILIYKKTAGERPDSTAAPFAPSGLEGEPSGAPSAETPASVSLALVVATSEQPAGDKPVVLSRMIESDVKAADTFGSTGQAAAAAGRACGTATILNTTARPYTFVATTRLLSKEGVLFRLRSAASIPANGTARVDVCADQSGPAGDIGPTTFTVPGLSPEAQKLVTARSDAPMTGGAGVVRMVTAEDIAKAKTELAARLNAQAQEKLRALLVDGEKVLPPLSSSQELSYTAPKVGAQTATFTVELTVRVRALVIPDSEIRSKLKSLMTASGRVLGETVYTVLGFDPAAGRAEVKAEAPIQAK